MLKKSSISGVINESLHKLRGLVNESASPDQISKWTQQVEDAADLRKMRFKDLNAKNIQALDIYDVQLAGSKIVPKLFRMVATLTHFTQLYPENKYS